MRLSDIPLAIPRFRPDSRYSELLNQGFPKGLQLELKAVRDVLMASKGDSILVAPGRWFILVNLPFQRFAEAIKSISFAKTIEDWTWRIEVIKDVPERKFVLAKLLEARIVARYVRAREYIVIERENEKKVIEGVEFTLSEGIRRIVQDSGVVELVIDGSSYRVRERLERSIPVKEERIRSVTWRIVDGSTQLAKILQRYSDILRDPMWRVHGRAIVVTDSHIVYIRVPLYAKSLNVELIPIELPSEEELLRCSRFYTIIVPRILWIDSSTKTETASLGKERYLSVYDVYFRGRKLKLVLTTEPPKTLNFRCLRQRAISSYAKRVLPRGIPYAITHLDYLTERDVERIRRFTEFVRSVLPKVEALRIQPETIGNGLELIAEILYINTPRRKLEAIKPYLEVFERVKDLAPQATLYLVFYGKRHRPWFVGFRIDKDGSVAVLSKRVVPISGIVMKGGEFEKRYREIYNLDNLVFFHYARTEEKLAILRDHVEEVREELRELGVELATASFKEVAEKVKELAMEKRHPDNMIYVFLQYMQNAKKEKWDSAWRNEVEKAFNIMVGLIKTGKYPEDYAKLKELGVLRMLRVANLWTMKMRGYSPKKGVLFLGPPEDVKRRILEVVKQMKGRVLALYEEVTERGIEVAMPEVPLKLKRVEALLKSLGERESS